MAQVKNGDRVKVQYTGKLQDGEVFDSSEEGQPLEFVVGGGDIIPGFEKGIMGMAVGDKRTIEIQPEDAYGPSREELVVEVPLNELPEHITPVLGQRLQVNQEGDQSVVVTITAMNEETVTLDANHPLAGRIIRFDVELVDVTPA